MAWARKNKIKIVSTYQTYSPNSRHGYCIEGSKGYGKVSYCVRNSHFLFPENHKTDFSKDMFEKYDQIIIPKETYNPFDEPRADRILTELNADEFIVIGANADGAVKATVLGLIQRGKKVTVISDAIGYQNPDTFDLACRKMQTKGANFVETKQLAGVSKLENVNACSCSRCRGKLRKHNLKIGAA